MAFARYKYRWRHLDFILYILPAFYGSVHQFILFPPDSDETVVSNSKATDALLLAVGQAQYPFSREYIYVFDNYWYRDNKLYHEVQKTSWDDVILDPDMKNTISHTIEAFFENERNYVDFGVPWKVRQPSGGTESSTGVLTVEPNSAASFSMVPPAMAKLCLYGP